MFLNINLTMPTKQLLVGTEIPLLFRKMNTESICKFLSTNDTFVPSPNCSFYNGHYTEASWSIAAIMSRIISNEWTNCVIGYNVKYTPCGADKIKITGRVAIMYKEWAVNLHTINNQEWMQIMSKILIEELSVR